MPFNREKTIKLADFLAKVRTRLQAQNNTEVITIFEIDVQAHLVEDAIERLGAAPELAELDLLAGDFDKIYPLVAWKLRNAASRNLSEIHPNTYEVAHAVSVAFCAELNEYFECSGADDEFDLIPIESVLQMLAKSQPTTGQ